MKILVIEDQSRMGRFLKKFFEEQNHTVTWSKSCEEARDALCEDTGAAANFAKFQPVALPLVGG